MLCNFLHYINPDFVIKSYFLNLSGKGWFDNMKEEFGPDFAVYSDDDKDEIFNQHPNLRDWSQRKRNHITKLNNSELLDARNKVFVLELDEFQFEKGNNAKSVRMAVSAHTTYVNYFLSDFKSF